MAAVFSSFHSNRPLQTQNGCIFAFKSKQQCSLTKMSKFVALLKKLEKSPEHCLNPRQSGTTLKEFDLSGTCAAL